MCSFFVGAEASSRVGIVSSSGYCGEREVGWRIKAAAESLGWTVFLDEDQGSFIQEMKDLDFVICLLPENTFTNPYCPNYLTIFHPFNFLTEKRHLLPFYEKYAGYLLTVHDGQSIEEGLKLKNKPFHYTSFYPTVHHVPYKEVVLKNLVTMIPVWSNRLNDKKFRSFYKLLSRDGLVSFYGINKNDTMIKRGYVGPIAFDGCSVIDVLQKHGVVLVLHSDIHNQEGLPTSRIFEASAASAVIISDENPFVRTHFGDCVFYIDTSLTASDIDRQVRKHMKFIKSNPKKALEMAKEAHQVFEDLFEMSSQLLKLEVMHKKVVAQ
jgi:hypothetical protein